LRVISDSESFYKVTTDDEGKVIDEARAPAIEWMLDVICDQEVARNHRLFRIHNFDVIELLELEGRKGYPYSVAE